jgi:pyridoxine 5-phosphate synthase
MIRLSVNINKVATLRNARGGNVPDVVRFALDCERFGAQGITVHPRPDERHIRYQDVRDLKKVVRTEFNVEGYPTESFMKLVCEVKPHQVTLVPDPPGVLTSNAGWDTKKEASFLKNIISTLHAEGIRSSLFVGADEDMVRAAAACGSRRIELYTEPYASAFPNTPADAIRPFVKAAQIAGELGLEVNAGHDLNLQNLAFFARTIPGLCEVSIGHALITDALYYGIENTIQLYLAKLHQT